MMRQMWRITRDYFALVDWKNKYLLAFVLIDILEIGAVLLLPYWASMVVEAVTGGNYGLALCYVALLGVNYLAVRVTMYGTNWCYANFFKETYVAVHVQLVKSIYEFDEDFAQKLPTGKIINSSNMDIVNIAELPSFIIDIALELVKLIIIYIVFAWQSWWLALYVLGIDSIYYIVARHCNVRSAQYFQKQRNYADKLTGVLSQILTGLKDVKCLGLGEKLDRKLDLYRKRWQVNYFQKRKYFFTRRTLVELIVDGGKLVLYVVMIVFLMRGRMQLAMFLLLLSYYEKARDGLKDIMSYDASALEEAVSLYRLREAVNYVKRGAEGEDSTGQDEDAARCSSESVVQRKAVGRGKRQGGKLDYTERRGEKSGRVEFRKVDFGYATRRRKATLRGVSFVAEPNQVTAIVGKAGAGKTTIFNLLLRLYRARRGKILVDGREIETYAKKTYNANLSVVNQRTFVFNMSIRANLALVDANKQRQIEACRRVGIHDFIMSLPDGYNTILKEDATNLSGGQKQLLSLARALLATSEIILLDEVTAALDVKTTRQVTELLEDLKVDHTLLVVTHDRELMKRADQIVVLERGRVVGRGKHTELMRENVVYQKLHSGV